MAQMKISVPCDPIKLSKEKLNDNWNFITSLHKYLTHSHQDSTSIKEDKHYDSTNHVNPKKSLENVYCDNFFQTITRQPFGTVENNLQKHSYNASKYSVGKLTKETPIPVSSPNKGKWSVNSHMFQNNLMPIIDRIKEILLKNSHDT